MKHWLEYTVLCLLLWLLKYGLFNISDVVDELINLTFELEELLRRNFFLYLRCDIGIVIWQWFVMVSKC